MLSEKEEYTEARDSRLLSFNSKPEFNSENLLTVALKSIKVPGKLWNMKTFWGSYSRNKIYNVVPEIMDHLQNGLENRNHDVVSLDAHVCLIH